jgi:hypothetical protein
MRADDAPRESGPEIRGTALDRPSLSRSNCRPCWIPTPASLFTTLHGNCPFRDAAETISQHFLPKSVSKR